MPPPGLPPQSKAPHPAPNLDTAAIAGNKMEETQLPARAAPLPATSFRRFATPRSHLSRWQISGLQTFAFGDAATTGAFALGAQRVFRVGFLGRLAGAVAKARRRIARRAGSGLGRRLAEGGRALRGLRARLCGVRCWRVGAVRPEGWAAGAVGGSGAAAPVGPLPPGATCRVCVPVGYLILLCGFPPGVCGLLGGWAQPDPALGFREQGN